MKTATKREYKSISVLPQHLVEANDEADRLGVKQYVFVAALLRAWKMLSERQQREALFPSSVDNRQAV